MREIRIKRFEELTNDELYDLLKARFDVFVLEQECLYPEIDDKDQRAVHVCLYEDGKLKAYLRVLNKGVSYEEASIGRVLSLERGKGYATEILKEGIKAAEEYFGADSIRIEAQTYAMSLYEKAGFERVSEEFLEDGIPHVEMLWRKR